MRPLSIHLIALTLATINCAPPPPGGPTPLTGWGSAQADGTLNSQEGWQNAGCANLTVDHPMGPKAGTVCVMNDAANLYVMMRYMGPLIDTISNNAAVHLDESGDWNIGQGDDLWIYYRTPAAGYDDHSWVGTATSDEDADRGGARQGSAAIGATATAVVYEFSHPLATGENVDINVAGGDTIGARFGFSVTGALSYLGDPPLVPIIIHTGAPEPQPCVTPFGVNRCRPPITMRPGLIELLCDLRPCIVRDDLPKNCLLKFPCPPCPGGLCPPFRLTFGGLTEAWDVEVVDHQGKRVDYRRSPTADGVELLFDAARVSTARGGLPDYSILFRLRPTGELNRRYQITARLDADRP